MLRFLTAGESHGQALVAILEGMPAGLAIDERRDHDAPARRQGGYGRGRRMAIESDRAQILARHPPRPHDRRAHRAHDREQGLGELAADDARRAGDCRADATGANRRRSPARGPATPTSPVPSKYGHDDMRNVLERASARETAARVAVGALARQLLAHFGIDIVSHVVDASAASDCRSRSR